MKKLLILLFVLGCFLGNAQKIVTGEYFFDTDPGINNATAFNFPAGEEVSLNLSIPTKGLTMGFHNLFIRVKNENGLWSHYDARPLYIADTTKNNLFSGRRPTIVSGEWFVDTDPGIGKGTSFALNADTVIASNLNIPTKGLTMGFHNLFIRVKNENGLWSHYDARPLYIADTTKNNLLSGRRPKIVSGEWFVDTDPGIGNGTSFALNADTVITSNLNIPTKGLTMGFHNLFIRVKNENGLWSHYDARPLYIADTTKNNLLRGRRPNIVSGEWFVDTDPGVGKAIAFSLKADTNIVETIAMQLPSLSVGDHQLFVRVKNELNVWSHYESRLFTVCPPPPAPKAKDTTICANSKAILTAKGTGIISWFNQEKGGKAIATGDTLRIETLQNTTTFYVQDSLCDVSATRTALKVTVLPLPVVKVLSSKNTMCLGDTTVLSVTGASTYVWSVLRDDKGRFVPKQTTTVTVKGLDAIGCASSDSVKLEVLLPTKSITTKAACGSFDWNGKNYTQSGDYTFTTKNKAGCDSVATLKLTINQPSNSTTTQIACGSYDWNGKNYTQSGDYTFTTKNKAGCDSVATLKLTINQPSNSTTTQIACGSYDWNGKNYTQSGDYTFTTKNKAGCDSVATLKLTINTMPIVSVAIENNRLVSKQKDAVYQWFICDKPSEKLDSSTNITYAPRWNGTYAVIIDLAGCKDTSDCVKYGTNAIATKDVSSFNIFPNPTTGSFALNGAPMGNYLVLNEVGAVVYRFEVSDQFSTQVDVHFLAKGVYYIKPSDVSSSSQKLVLID